MKPPPPKRSRIQLTKTRVPLGGEMLELHHVRDIDVLMDNMSREEIADEKIPYYGSLWPASIGLARWVWRSLDLYGKEVMDLGCGVGLTGIAAAKRGGHVFFADYFSQAVELARINAKKNGCEGQDFGTVDWRDAKFNRQFDLIMASDVLYEARNHEPIFKLLQRCLHPGGMAVISDPKRPPSKPFFDLAQSVFDVRFSETPVQSKDLTIQVDIVQLYKKDARS